MDSNLVLQLGLLEHRIKELYPAKDGFEHLIQVRNMGWKEKQLLRELLKARKRLLDSLFQETPAELGWLAGVNGRLLGLSKKLSAKTFDVYASLHRTGHDPAFDDDIMIEGTLRFRSELFEEDDSVLPVDGDEGYGSDFKWMLALISELDEEEEYYPCAKIIVSYRKDNPLDKVKENIYSQAGHDDGVSWDHIGRFRDLCMCHALYSLHSKNLFSYPDILHMNSFWCEVKVLHQLIVDLKGNRTSYIEKD